MNMKELVLFVTYAVGFVFLMSKTPVVGAIIVAMILLYHIDREF